MKTKKNEIALCILCALCLASCESVNKYCGLEDDNAFEEITEQVIDEEVGLDLDLTPSSPEKK